MKFRLNYYLISDKKRYELILENVGQCYHIVLLYADHDTVDIYVGFIVRLVHVNKFFTNVTVTAAGITNIVESCFCSHNPYHAPP